MAFSELLVNVVFYAVAAAALGGGIAVALSKNIVRSAFALLTVLFSVAGVYALVRADFMVAAQVLIYVGGILVLIIFAIMLTHKITDVKLSNESSPGPVSITACARLRVVAMSAGSIATLKSSSNRTTTRSASMELVTTSGAMSRIHAAGYAR